MRKSKYLVTLFFEATNDKTKLKKMQKKFVANSGHEAIEQALKDNYFDRTNWKCYGQSAKKVR